MSEKLTENWLSLVELARVMGISKQKLRAMHDRMNQPFERREGDAKNAMALINAPQWLRHWAQVEASRTDESERDPDLKTGNSPQLERYRKAKADLAEIELAQKRGELLTFDELKNDYAMVLSYVRRSAETMCPECRNQHIAACDMADAEFEQRFQAEQVSR